MSKAPKTKPTIGQQTRLAMLKVERAVQPGKLDKYATGSSLSSIPDGADHEKVRLYASYLIQRNKLTLAIANNASLKDLELLRAEFRAAEENFLSRNYGPKTKKKYSGKPLDKVLQMLLMKYPEKSCQDLWNHLVDDHNSDPRSIDCLDCIQEIGPIMTKETNPKEAQLYHINPLTNKEYRALTFESFRKKLLKIKKTQEK